MTHNSELHHDREIDWGLSDVIVGHVVIPRPNRRGDGQVIPGSTTADGVDG